MEVMKWGSAALGIGFAGGLGADSCENVSVQSPGFADLSLCTVAVYGVLEQALGHGYKQLKFAVGSAGQSARFLFAQWSKDNTERKSRARLVSAREERFYSLAAAETLTFGEFILSC